MDQMPQVLGMCSICKALPNPKSSLCQVNSSSSRCTGFAFCFSDFGLVSSTAACFDCQKTYLASSSISLYFLLYLWSEISFDVQWQFSSWAAGENSLVHRCCQPRVGAGNDWLLSHRGGIVSPGKRKGMSLLGAHLSSLSESGSSWGCWPLVPSSIGPSFLLPLKVARPLSCHSLSVLCLWPAMWWGWEFTSSGRNQQVFIQ